MMLDLRMVGLPQAAGPHPTLNQAMVLTGWKPIPRDYGVGCFGADNPSCCNSDDNFSKVWSLIRSLGFTPPT